MTPQVWIDSGNQRWQPSIAVLIPVFNEAARIHLVEALTQKLCAAFAEREDQVAIVYVNDASTDETEMLLQQMIAHQQQNQGPCQQGKIRLSQIVLPANTRKAGIYGVARQQIVADYYLFIDADDSFAIADVMHILQVARRNQYDLVVGQKPVANENTDWARAAIRFLNRLLSKPLLPAGITDSQTGLKVFHRHVVQAAFGGVKAQHGFTADLVVLYAAKQLGFRAYNYSVQCINRDLSHVNILPDSVHHLQVIVALYLTALVNVQQTARSLLSSCVKPDSYVARRTTHWERRAIDQEGIAQL